MSNPQRRGVLGRVREAHPAATAAAAAAAPDPAPPPPTRPVRPGTVKEGTTQLNTRVPVSLKARAEQATLALGVREGRRVTLNELVENALDTYLTQQEL